MTQDQLTRKQRKLIKELHALTELLTLDFQNATSYDKD